MKRLIALTALVLVSGLTGSLLTENALTPRPAPPTPLAFRQPVAQLDGGAQPASAASLNVAIQVQSVAINVSASTYTETVGLASGDTSGLSSFSMSWTGTGVVPRYAIGAITTLALP